jgi:hypothetical protein
VRAKQKAGLGEATINRHLNLLHKLYDDARRQRGIETANPVDDVSGWTSRGGVTAR